MDLLALRVRLGLELQVRQDHRVLVDHQVRPDQLAQVLLDLVDLLGQAVLLDPVDQQELVSQGLLAHQAPAVLQGQQEPE